MMMFSGLVYQRVRGRECGLPGMGYRKSMLPDSYQIVREDELGSCDVVERQSNFARLGEKTKITVHASN
jgi:hypothetical protein